LGLQKLDVFGSFAKNIVLTWIWMCYKSLENLATFTAITY